MLKEIKKLSCDYVDKLEKSKRNMTKKQIARLALLFRFYRLLIELNNFKSDHLGDTELFARQFLLITNTEK